MADKADTALAVGDTIYRFDPNRRVYDRGDDGRQSGGPIYSEHFTSYTITGETTKSWLVKSGFRDLKVNKQTMLEAQDAYAPIRWFTEEGRADDIWLQQHRYAIVRLCERADANKLRKVAEILGYEAKE